MTKWRFKPEVIVEGSFPEARNKLLRVLAQAEVDEKIVRYDVGFYPEEVR